MSDEKRLVADIDERLKQRAKADPRPIKEIVEESLRREFMAGDNAAVERRIEETEQRIQNLKREINERKRELAKHQERLERYKSKLEEFDEYKYDQLGGAIEALENVPKDPDNPGVKNWADKIGITPEELLEEIEKHTD